MSEEILEALMELFGIVAKQGGGATPYEIEYVRSFLKSQLGDRSVDKYLGLFKTKASEGIKYDKEGKLVVSSRDSVKVLGQCKKLLNHKLSSKQRVIVMVRLHEMQDFYERSHPRSTDPAEQELQEQILANRRQVISDGVAPGFFRYKPYDVVVSDAEIASIAQFCNASDAQSLDTEGILVYEKEPDGRLTAARSVHKRIDGQLAVMRVDSVNLYFIKYFGKKEVTINRRAVPADSVQPLSPGSIVRISGTPVFYSEIVAQFDDWASQMQKMSFEVNHVWLRFKSGGIGLRDINMAEKEGTLVGIMGASGAGKTTLLNVLCGNDAPTKGEVLINGRNLHTQKEELEGVIGLIPQDDLLIEELTVYQNLYYSAKLCFRNMSEEEIDERVCKTLKELGLYERRGLQVGSPLNKTISGGQRKRLNIALELIREPPILFVDEPTSGLSSADSDNVMILLRELSLKGKLVFVVIHQPSSDIYKMFDKMFILDTGGYTVYYGEPADSVTYFRRQENLANAEDGECPTCGNINPEQVFSSLEASELDEWGDFTGTRKRKPDEWNDIYVKSISDTETATDADGKEVTKIVETHWPKVERVQEQPPRSLDIPSWIRQFAIYTKRDFWAKISNTQYILLNILEAPVLGFVLAYLIRYIVDPDSDVYIFRENANIPIYIFMATVVAIFFGLIISAEEIFKDAKILKREAFLNLSRSAYLMSKIVILMGISAIQMLLFILVGNFEIDFYGMNTEFFLMLFAVAVSSNILGLIISSAFNSIVTIYIMIPLIMIPQMVLGGAMFTFDKLNKDVSSVDKVPLVAEIIPARYAYEGLTVYQYKHNNFKKAFFDVEMAESRADFKQVYYLPKLQDALDDAMALYSKGRTDSSQFIMDLALLHNELGKEIRRLNAADEVNPRLYKTEKSGEPLEEISFAALDKLTPETFNAEVCNQTKDFINELTSLYRDLFLKANSDRERKIDFYLNNQKEVYNRLKDDYFNEAVSDVVRKTFDKNKILRDGDKLIQIVDPIYQIPEPEGLLRFRSHFFTPRKYFFGTYIDTLWFNIMAVWVISAFLYVILYYDLARRAFDSVGTAVFKAQEKWTKRQNERRRLKAEREAAAEAERKRKAEEEAAAAEEARKKEENIEHNVFQENQPRARGSPLPGSAG